MAVDVMLRFRDLKNRNLVNNYVTLARWIEREGFPPGLMLGPNTRVWREAAGIRPKRPSRCFFRRRHPGSFG